MKAWVKYAADLVEINETLINIVPRAEQYVTAVIDAAVHRPVKTRGGHTSQSVGQRMNADIIVSVTVIGHISIQSQSIRHSEQILPPKQWNQMKDY